MRTVIYAALLVLVTACALAQSHTTVRHHREIIEEQPVEIAQAEEAIQKNEFAAARPLLKKALDKDPKNYQAWFDLGFVENKLGHPDESIHAYRQSVAAKPDVFESNLNLGLMLARSNSPEAERFLRTAAELKPTDHVEEGQARAWLSLGHLLENHKPDEAISAYEKAASLAPQDPEPHLSAGLLYERLKDFSKAESQYKQVLALDPRSNEAVIGLTNIYMKSGRLADAEPLLRQLSAQRPDDAGLHLQLGRVLAAKGNNDEGIAELQTALKLSPGDSEAQREIADLEFQAGKYDEAAKAFRELSSRQPNDAGLHQSLGEALLKQKQFPEAQKEFIAALKLKPDSGQAWGSLAVAADENQDYQLAIKAADMRAKYLPDTPVSYFLRATAYDHLRDFQTASKYYHLFLDSAKGQYPDQEWQARHRLIAIEPRKK
jgi:Flp pilus assembly protein TadD